jgi:ABC-type transport system involved in multi-copper enzyme maturation permease subunit
MTVIASLATTTPSPFANRPSPRTSLRTSTRAVVAALASERIKASTIGSNRAILGLGALGGVLMSWLVAKFITDKVLTVTEVGFFWTTVVSVLAMISGVLLFTAEAQHGTLAGMLTAQPARWTVALAKTLTAGGIGLVLGVVGLCAGFLGAVTSGLGAGERGIIPATIGWALIFTTVSGVLGLGIGMIVRHSAAAVSGVLVWGFVIEPLLNAFLPAKAARLLPFVAGNHLLAYKSDINPAKSLPVQLSRPENLLIFGTYVAVALIVATVLLNRRDTN